MKTLMLVLLCTVMVACSGGHKKKPAPIPPPPVPVQPCEFTLRWTNPTEDILGYALDPDELVEATAYFFRVPEEPRAVDLVHGGIQPYTLMFTFVGAPSDRGITYYIHFTVSNLDKDGVPQESDASNQVSKTCE